MQAIDIWGTARKMREIYGLWAGTTAQQRAKKAQKNGDLAGAERWRDIARAVTTGPSEKPAGAAPSAQAPAS